jgi:hypothetical protein
MKIYPMRNELPLHISSNFVCPGDGEVCPVKARIRDFGSCVVRIYAMDATLHKGQLWRGAEIKAEFTVTECAECGYNKIAAAVIRELINPTPRPKPYPLEDGHSKHNYE